MKPAHELNQKYKATRHKRSKELKMKDSKKVSQDEPSTKNRIAHQK